MFSVTVVMTTPISRRIRLRNEWLITDDVSVYNLKDVNWKVTYNVQ